PLSSAVYATTRYRPGVCALKMAHRPDSDSIRSASSLALNQRITLPSLSAVNRTNRPGFAFTSAGSFPSAAPPPRPPPAPTRPRPHQAGEGGGQEGAQKGQPHPVSRPGRRPRPSSLGRESEGRDPGNDNW